MRAPVAILPLLIVAFAGCLEDASPKEDPNLRRLGNTPGSLYGKLNLTAGPALWKDPQNTPHPAYNYPSLSSPPAGENVPKWWKPIPAAELPKALAGIQLLSKSPEQVKQGGGIALFGSLAIVPGYGSPSAVIDISDPAKPNVLSTFKPPAGQHRGATLIPYPDGRLVTVISMSSGLDAWDLTDPTSPIHLGLTAVRSHKVGVIPGTPIVYNAGSGGGGIPAGYTDGTATGITQIYDYSKPEEPVKVKDWRNGYSCHHVYFWNDVATKKFRGICAGIEYTQLWDTANPLDPKVIVSVPVHHGVAGTPSASVPIVAFSHYAGLSQDGKTLLVGDELGGGSLPPGCVAEVRTPAASASTPLGALWFYDVSTETRPVLKGWYSPLNDPRIKQPGRSCTAHHGRMVPVEGRDVVAMSFYGAGVVLLDYTQAPVVRVIDQFAQDSNTWETWYYNGYLFTGDLARGMDILKFR